MVLCQKTVGCTLQVRELLCQAEEISGGSGLMEKMECDYRQGVLTQGGFPGLVRDEIAGRVRDGAKM